MDEITLNEFIGINQTYELRKSFQIKETNKNKKSIVPKALKSDDSNLDEKIVAMIIRKYKHMFIQNNLKGKGRLLVVLDVEKSFG